MGGSMKGNAQGQELDRTTQPAGQDYQEGFYDGFLPWALGAPQLGCIGYVWSYDHIRV